MVELRTIIFFDGQNLFHGAREAWSPWPRVPGSPYGYPSYDVEKLALSLVSREGGRSLREIRFYTGVPASHKSQKWHGFWSNKLRVLDRRGIYVYKGRINPGGQEKGVDVSIAIDLVRLTYEQTYETAIIVSSDSDLGPAIELAKEVANGQNRRLLFESAFPHEPSRYERRGIKGTKWVRIDKPQYDSCRDLANYFPY